MIVNMSYFLSILSAVGVSALLAFLIGAAGASETKPANDTDVCQLELPSNEPEKEKLRAFVRCSGHDAEYKYTYVGARDCFSAGLLAGGSKACEFSCLGLGSCAAACPHGAISVVSGVAEVDTEKCDGCGKCVNICPRGIIALIPFGSEYNVRCSNRSLGSLARKICEDGCIGCHACEKTCKHGAIEIVESLAYIDPSKCTSCGECAKACPRGIITAPPAEEEEFDETEYFKLSVDAEDTEDAVSQ